MAIPEPPKAGAEPDKDSDSVLDALRRRAEEMKTLASDARRRLLAIESLVDVAGGLVPPRPSAGCLEVARLIWWMMSIQGHMAEILRGAGTADHDEVLTLMGRAADILAARPAEAPDLDKMTLAQLRAWVGHAGGMKSPANN